MQSFTQFCNEVSGYTFHDKFTGAQVYRWEMYWSGLTPSQCFKNYFTREIIHPNYVSY